MKKTNIFLFIIFFLSFPSFFCQSEPNIEVEESIWNLGTLRKGQVVEKIFKLKNTGADRLIIKKVRPGCNCISLYILNGEAEAGGFAEVRAVFDTNSKEVKNKFNKYIYIQSNDPNSPVIRISVAGNLKGDKQMYESIKEKETLIDSGNEIKNGIKVTLFYSPGCMGCSKVKDVFLIKMKERYKESIKIERYDISILENYLSLIEYEERYGMRENDPMVVFVGDRYFSGRRAILTKLEAYIKDLIGVEKKADEKIKEINKEKLLKRFRLFNPFIVFSAGFIDGLNPCAFVTIVFLISFLLIAEKKRREVFIICLVFSSAVLSAYLLIGLGLRGILYKLLIFSAISDFIYIFAICIVFMLSFYSLYDAIVYFKYRDARNIKIKLPEIFVKKIHNVIRENIGNRGLIFFVFLAGFLVSLLESICTGQVYLPTIMFMIKEPSMRVSSFLYLILYNLAFIIPLLVVALLTILGVTLKRFVDLSKRNTFISKIFLAVLFFVMGILLFLAK